MMHYGYGTPWEDEKASIDANTGASEWAWQLYNADNSIEDFGRYMADAQKMDYAVVRRDSGIPAALVAFIDKAAALTALERYTWTGYATKADAALDQSTVEGIDRLKGHAATADSVVEQVAVLAELQRGTRDSDADETSAWITDQIALAMGQAPPIVPSPDATADLKEEIKALEGDSGKKVPRLGVFGGYMAKFNFLEIKWYWWLLGTGASVGAIGYMLALRDEKT